METMRPIEAATLIIVMQGDQPKILMGKRAATHKFMPNKFVFPGGRLDLIDQRLQVPKQLSDPVLKRLRKHTRKNVSDNKLRGLALAAVRETYEETGLIIGEHTEEKLRTSSGVWQKYFNYGIIYPIVKIKNIGPLYIQRTKSSKCENTVRYCCN